jgi:hypothetical protein
MRSQLLKMPGTGGKATLSQDLYAVLHIYASSVEEYLARSSDITRGEMP